MAWRNIWRNKTRSIVIALSVATGLFAGLAVLALHKGMLKSRIRTVIDREIGHLQLHHPQFKEDFDPQYLPGIGAEELNAKEWATLVKSVAGRSVTQAMLSTTTGSAGVQVNGVIAAAENDVSQLGAKIKEGPGLSGKKKNEIIISRKLAGKMKLRLGSKVVLTFADTAANIVAAAFRINGIFQTDNSPLDERNVYVTRTALNQLLGIGESSHELVVLLHHDDDLELAKRKLQAKYPALLVETWRDISPETDLMVSTMDLYMYIIIGIIMLALTFGIVNTMLMAILERRREIGMVVALGMNRIKLFTLVLMETAFLTLVGTPFGLLTAFLVTEYFRDRGIDTSSFAGETMSSFGFSSIVYPEFPSGELYVVMTIVIITALVACIFPAIKSARLVPVEALKK